MAGAVIAVLTLVGLVPNVHPQVFRQVALLAGAVIAVRTVEALLPSCTSRCFVRVLFWLAQ